MLMECFVNWQTSPDFQIRTEFSILGEPLNTQGVWLPYMYLPYYMRKMSTMDITSSYYREIPVFFNLIIGVTPFTSL